MIPVRIVCTECMIEKKAKFQAIWNNKEFPIGSNVKLSFSDPTGKIKGNESMWVQVEENLGNGNYSGFLNNDPVKMLFLHDGDKIEFNVEDVSEFYG